MNKRTGILGLTAFVGVVVTLLACTAAADEEQKPKPDTGAGLDALADANTAFALDLFAALRKDEGNLFFSPYSISTALAMTRAGARNETAGQMAGVLHLAGLEDVDRTFAALRALDRGAGTGPGCRLHLANALWGQKGYAFLDEFLALQESCYGARLGEVDFVNAGEEARLSINRWVEDRTESKIKDLLRETDIDKSTALVLTNAIYFKGAWANRFDRALTRERPFLVSEEKKVIVPFMSRRGTFGVAYGSGVSLLELPYQGGRLSMLLLLPDEDSSLAHLEQSLSGRNLDRWISGLRDDMVSVLLPRFKIQSRSDLARTLKGMGMVDAFDRLKADFSGMTGKKDLFISAVIHQACAEITEEGTEAAAATAVVMKKGLSRFVLNRPFVFLIRDRRSGSIHFVGRVVDPTL